MSLIFDIAVHFFICMANPYSVDWQDYFATRKVVKYAGSIVA
jgi:hypothetical protein